MDGAVTGAANRTQSGRFRCDIVRDEDAVRIVLEGELDISTAPTVEEALREAAS